MRSRQLSTKKFAAVFERALLFGSSDCYDCDKVTGVPAAAGMLGNCAESADGYDELILASGLGDWALIAKEKEGVFRDDLTGQLLVPELVRAARKKELEYFNSKGVWEKCQRAAALAATGRKPITVRWVDVNKGDDDEPNYRSRLVAREIRKKGDNPMFAPTPPLESLRTVLSLAATEVRNAIRHDRRPDLSLIHI